MINVLRIHNLYLEQVRLKHLEFDLNVLNLEELNMVRMNVMRTP